MHTPFIVLFVSSNKWVFSDVFQSFHWDIWVSDVHTGAYPLSVFVDIECYGLELRVFFFKDGCLWYFQLSDFNHMCGYGILTWYWYLRLGHNSLSPLVTFVSLSCRGIPLAFHLLMVIVFFSCHFVIIFWCYTEAYPFLLSWWRCLISGLFESFVGNPESHIGAYPFVIKVSTSAVASWVSPLCSEFCFKASPICLGV